MKFSRGFSLFPQLILVLIASNAFPTDGVWTQSGAVGLRTSTATTSSSQPVPQTPRRVGQSTLTGRVIYEGNEQPLKGARVRIFIPTGVERPLVAFANNGGEFRVEKLAAGKYYISVEGEGIAAPSFCLRLFPQAQNTSLSRSWQAGTI